MSDKPASLSDLIYSGAVTIEWRQDPDHPYVWIVTIPQIPKFAGRLVTESKSEVRPQMYFIPQGQTVVRKGEIVEDVADEVSTIKVEK